MIITQILVINFIKLILTASVDMRNDYALAKLKAGAMALRDIRPFARFVLDYFDCITGGNPVYTVRGRNTYVTRPHTRDCATIAEVELLGVYQPSGFEIRANDTIIDIGAHIGTFSVRASRFASSGTIYSFEPFPENFSMLQRNLQLNALTNVKSFQIAISGAAGVAPLFISETNSGGHSLVKSAPTVRHSTRSVPVTVKSLEQVIEENGINRVDFLKIDCEGAEYDILRSTSRATFEIVEKISVECHKIAGRDNKTLRPFLEERGFRVSFGLENHEVAMLYAKR